MPLLFLRGILSKEFARDNSATSNGAPSLRESKSLAPMYSMQYLRSSTSGGELGTIRTIVPSWLQKAYRLPESSGGLFPMNLASGKHPWWGGALLLLASAAFAGSAPAQDLKVTLLGTGSQHQ